MIEQTAQPEEIAQVQPEQTAATPTTESAPGAPFNPLAAKVAAARAEILGAKAEAQPLIDDPEEETDEVETEPEKDDTARQQLAAEKRAREERASLKAEKDAWQAEQQEALEKVAKFEESVAEIEFDPLGHLESSGLSDEALMDLGREIFFKFMPDHVTPELKAEMANLKRERRIRKLERGIESKPKAAAKAEPKADEPPKMDPEAYATYEAEYKASLSEQASIVDAEQFPLAAEYDAATLEDAMFKVAVQHAQTSPSAGDLSPIQTLEEIEDFLKRNPDAQKKKPEEARPKQPAPRSIRNRTTAARPNTKQPQTLEEKLAARDAHVRAKYNLGRG